MAGAGELNSAVASARTVAQSMVRAAAGLGRMRFSADEPVVMPEPANESIEPAPVRPEPSIISANTEMKGEIATPDEIHIHGKVEGDIRASRITVCAGGAVKGDLAAEKVEIYGAVEGAITARDVMLRAGAVVKGEIAHCTLGVDTAAIFEGVVKRTPA